MISIAISSICLFQGQVFSGYILFGSNLPGYYWPRDRDVASHVRVIGATAWHKKDTVKTKVKKEEEQQIEPQKESSYFPLNPGWLIGILISWFMK